MGQAAMIQEERSIIDWHHKCRAKCTNTLTAQWNMQAALLHAAHSAVCEIIAARQSRLHHTNLHLHRSTARARNAPAAAGCIIICSECKTVALQLSEEQSPLLNEVTAA
jgi:hypothetical protein